MGGKLLPAEIDRLFAVMPGDDATRVIAFADALEVFASAADKEAAALAIRARFASAVALPPHVPRRFLCAWPHECPTVVFFAGLRRHAWTFRAGFARRLGTGPGGGKPDRRRPLRVESWMAWSAGGELRGRFRRPANRPRWPCQALGTHGNPSGCGRHTPRAALPWRSQ